MSYCCDNRTDIGRLSSKLRNGWLYISSSKLRNGWLYISSSQLRNGWLYILSSQLRNGWLYISKGIYLMFIMFFYIYASLKCWAKLRNHNLENERMGLKTRWPNKQLGTMELSYLSPSFSTIIRKIFSMLTKGHLGKKFMLYFILLWYLTYFYLSLHPGDFYINQWKHR